MIDTGSNTTVGAPIPVGNGPWGLALSPDGSRLYTGNSGSGNVTMIDTASITVLGAIDVEAGAEGVAVSPDGRRVYVANSRSRSISVIDF